MRACCAARAGWSVRWRSAAPRLAFVKTPAWDRADASTHAAFAALCATLGTQCEEITLPGVTSAAWAWHQTIMEAEMAVQLEPEWTSGREQLSDSLRKQLARGRDIRAFDYLQAQAHTARLVAGFSELFSRFAALITPATASTAPALGSTGDPAFGTLWSLAGLPALSLPLLRGSDGLPLGVQLVGARGADARLLRSARWLERALAIRRAA